MERSQQNHSRGPLGRLAVAVAAAMLAAPSMAQDFVERANALYDDIRRADRSDLVVLPAVAEMREPPRGVETVEKAALVAPGASVWEAARAWASEPQQQAAIEALDRVTRESDYRYAMAFGQPYGVEALATNAEDLQFVSAGLYTELDVGGSPLLAAADFRYIDGLRRLFALVQVEATRLAEEGQIVEALDVLADAVFFARQLADREFAAEMRFGMEMMIRNLERLRDLAYTDFRGDRHLAGHPDAVIELIDRLAESGGNRGAGFIRVEHMTFPQGDRLAALQLIQQVLKPRAERNEFSAESGANPQTFIATMARISTGGRPLRLFSEMARWRDVAEDQVDGRTATQQLERIYGDLVARWELRDPFDPQMRRPLELSRINLAESTAIALTTGQLPGLFDHWQQLRVEAVGTRHALALVGYSYRFNSFPPAASSVRPRWLAQIELDPLNADARQRGQSLRYILPGRDTPTDVHTVNVVVQGYPNFQKRLRDDTFILYSEGTDDADNLAREVQNTMDPVAGADYLLWPPLTSLLREELERTGQFR